MMTTHALAAGQSGAESQPLPEMQSPARETSTHSQDDEIRPEESQAKLAEPSPCQAPAQPEHPQETDAPVAPENPPDDAPPDDETQRRHAADRLSQQLDLNVDLSVVCEHLAGIPKKGRIEAIHAAARLAQANAQLGRSLAQFLKIERRQITIVQHLQPSVPISKHSNSSGSALPESGVIDDLLSQFFRYMKLYAAEELGPALERAALMEKPDDQAAPAA